VSEGRGRGSDLAHRSIAWLASHRSCSRRHVVAAYPLGSQSSYHTHQQRVAVVNPWQRDSVIRGSIAHAGQLLRGIGEELQPLYAFGF
jgi:hypothetical protein